MFNYKQKDPIRTVNDDYPNKSTNLVVLSFKVGTILILEKKRFKSYATLLPQFNSLEEQES